MSSKRLRRLRNRQDRTNFQNQVKQEVQEPFMDSNQENQDPIVNDLKNDELENGLDSAVVGDLANTTAKDKSVVDSSANLEKIDEIISSSVLEDDKVLNDNIDNLQNNAPQSEPVNLQQEQVLNNKADDLENNVPQETVVTSEALNNQLESVPDFAHEEKIQASDVEDPDLVPQNTTLTDDNVPKRAGAILKHCREKLGLSIREVANRLNTRVNTISDIENDRLNQPTAVAFTRVHISNYAKLVNMDPQLLISLYEESVQKTVLENQNAHDNSERQPLSQALRIGALVVIILMIVSLILVIYRLFTTPEPSNTGALVLEDTVQTSADSQGVITLDTQNSKFKAKVVEAPKAVDPNTKMAQEQALSLDTNEIINAQAQTVSDDLKQVDTQMSLKVKNKVEPIIEEPLEPFEDVAEDNAVSDLKVVNLESSNKSTVKNNTSQSSLKQEINFNPPKSEQIKSETPKAQTQKAEEPKEEIAKSNTPVVAEQQVEKVEKTVVTPLNGSLKDISSAVKLAGKIDPFETLNSVSIRLLHDCALEVKGNGKVIKKGVFKQGETLKISGIPPIRLSVTDTKNIRVSYRGTTVVVPASKQVTFELPMR